MSLYYVQKLIYTLNRDPNVVAQFQTDMDGVLKEYTLTDEEKHAIRNQNRAQGYQAAAMLALGSVSPRRREELP